MTTSSKQIRLRLRENCFANLNRIGNIFHKPARAVPIGLLGAPELKKAG